MSKQEIFLSFPKEEEIAVFLLEDLIKEYNSSVIISPPYRNKYPLSLKALNENNAIIRPMTQTEIDSMRFYELQAGEWHHLKKIISDQVSRNGLLSNVPNLAGGISIIEVINELGLKGKVNYKTVGDKTYVILKGYAGERNILKGTRYLNTNPEIVRFGLAKVSVSGMFKTGLKTSIWVYCSIKALEAVEMCLEKGQLESDFFSKIPGEIPKMAISTLIAASAGGVVSLIGLPVAVGAGLILAVGLVSGIGLEYYDRKSGFSEKLSEAVERPGSGLQA